MLNPYWPLRRLLVLVCIQWALPIVSAADYYIDSRAGDNANSGTSANKAWRDFSRINGRILAPGDRLYLASGSLWDQELSLGGIGTADSPIVLTSYGPGPRPRIARSSALTDRTLTLKDVSFWTISNLELSNANMGLEIDYTGFGFQGIAIDNLFIHDIDLDIDGLPSGPGSVFYSAGILISFRPELPNPSLFALNFKGLADAVAPKVSIPNQTQYTLSGLRIANCEIARTTAPIVLGTSFVVGDYSPNSFRNVLIRDNRIHDARGPINTAFVTGCLWINNVIARVGTNPLIQGTTAVFVSNSERFQFINNWLSQIPDTASHDGSAIDLEAFNGHPEILGNVITDTTGAAVEILFVDDGIFQSGQHDYNTDIDISCNLFERNTKWGGVNEQSAVITAFGTRKGDPYNQSGSINNNILADQRGEVALLGPSGGWRQFTTNNNLDVSHNYLTNAAVDFAGTQHSNDWSYEWSDGKAWSRMSFDKERSRWGTSKVYVTQFNLMPLAEAGSGVARAWTAPLKGYVSVRGRILNEDEGQDSDVGARITKNGAKIWPLNEAALFLKKAGASGVDAHLDGVMVEPGDVLRFEVSEHTSGDSSSELISWIPTIAYSSDGPLVSAKRIDDRP